MKKLSTTLIILISAIVLSTNAFAGGDGFTGVVVYNITYPEGDLDPQMASMMPKTMKMKIKGDKSRTEISMGMGTTVAIFDGEANTGVTLIDMMGQKFAMKISPDDVEKELNEQGDVEINVTAETKEIAGYTCKKAIVTVTDDKDKTEMEVYFTNELGTGGFNYNNNPAFKDIEGVMLEYTLKEEKMTMTLTAVSVDKKKVADSEFEIPEGYKEISESDLKNMFGGY
jgi:GLPGLI family protein